MVMVVSACAVPLLLLPHVIFGFCAQAWWPFPLLVTATITIHRHRLTLSKHIHHVINIDCVWLIVIYGDLFALVLFIGQGLPPPSPRNQT